MQPESGLSKFFACRQTVLALNAREGEEHVLIEDYLQGLQLQTFQGLCGAEQSPASLCWIFFRKQRCADPRFACFFSPIFLFFFTEKNKYQECLGQELFLETFFLAAVNWLSSLFFGFWFRKRLSATIRLPRTQKPRKEQKKTKKSKDSEECLGQGLCSEALVFLCFFFFVFLGFFWFLVPEAFIGY